MFIRNNGVTEDEVLQNFFTAYLREALRHQKRDYLRGQENYQTAYYQLCAEEESHLLNWDRELLAQLPWGKQIDRNTFSNALAQLTERERYVFLSCAVAGKDYSALSKELGIGYKGIAAIYYRTRKKLQKQLEGKLKL